MGLNPTGGHGDVLSVCRKSCLKIVSIGVAFVTSLMAVCADLKQTAMQVVLRLAFCRRLLCGHTPHRCNVCTCTLQVSFQDFACTAQYKRLHFEELFFVHSQVGPACSHSIILPLSIPSISRSRHLKPHRTKYQRRSVSSFLIFILQLIVLDTVVQVFSFLRNVQS